MDTNGTRGAARGQEPTGSPICQPLAVIPVFEWLTRHSRDLDEAAWWRAFHGTTDVSERLRLVLRRVERRPGEPMLPRHDPDVSRAAIIVAYLRGEWSAEDLPALSAPAWPWLQICAFAETQGAGWDSFQEPDSARGALRVYRLRGYLDIPTASEGTDAEIVGFLTGLGGTVDGNLVFVSRTAAP